MNVEAKKPSDYSWYTDNTGHHRKIDRKAGLPKNFRSAVILRGAPRPKQDRKPHNDPNA